MLKSPEEMARPRVTAGLIWASELPQAMAVKTAAITAKANPVVMTIQPEPYAFDFLRSTPATTPLPSNTRTSVPINSPKNGLCMWVENLSDPAD